MRGRPTAEELRRQGQGAASAAAGRRALSTTENRLHGAGKCLGHKDLRGIGAKLWCFFWTPPRSVSSRTVCTTYCTAVTCTNDSKTRNSPPPLFSRARSSRSRRRYYRGVRTKRSCGVWTTSRRVYPALALGGCAAAPWAAHALGTCVVPSGGEGCRAVHCRPQCRQPGAAGVRVSLDRLQCLVRVTLQNYYPAPSTMLDGCNLHVAPPPLRPAALHRAKPAQHADSAHRPQRARTHHARITVRRATTAPRVVRDLSAEPRARVPRGRTDAA